MKATADKAHRPTTSSAQRGESPKPFFAKKEGGDFFKSHVQTKMTVNSPGDKFEKEADSTAGKVMKMSDKDVQKVQRAPAMDEKVQKKEEDKLRKKEEDKLQRAPAVEEKVQRAPAVDEKVQKKDEDRLQKKEEDKLQRAPAVDEKVQKKDEDKLQKKEEEKLQKKEEEKIQKKEGGTPSVGNVTQTSIRNKTTGGQPMSSDVRSFMEPRFGADFGNVRIHADAEAASLSNQLSARAFTYRNHIFFSRDQYQPGSSDGKELLAHELTHTIQQGHAIQRSPQITTTTTPPPIQRLGISDALDYFADAAYNIPGYRMLTIVIGFNPINMSATDRSAANILRALIEFMPGGHLITQALDNHGVFNKAGEWVEQQMAALGDIGSSIGNALDAFLDSLSWTDIFDLGGVWDRAKRIFTTPVDQIIDFAGNIVSGILALVREAVLRPLAALAEGTAGYDLLKAVLGQDPITGDPVPRNADTLIGGFMKLIGRDDIWENIKKGNAIERAWAWFQGALSGLMGLVTSIPGRIMDLIASLTWQDVITIVGVFSKVGEAFLNIASDFMSWAAQQVLGLLEIIFTVVAPGAVPYIKRAAGAFNAIIENPIGFVGNLVRAGKLGFQRFASNIGNHLKTALIKWLTGPLGDAGVYIPKSFDLMEILKLVLSVLGLTWQNIRTKLVRIIPEPVLVLLEKSATILVTLIKDGPLAAWEQIKAELNELKGMLIAQVTQMVTEEIVKAAVTKLVMMLNPAGAVIQAIIAIYNTITFFIEKINQIAAVVGSFIDSVAAIASGQVDAAAAKVEQTMANTLVVVIGFLAKFAGLGNIPNKLVGIVRRIRKPIDKGLDRIVAWLGTILKKIGGAIKAGAKKLLQWWKKRVPVSGDDKPHTLTFEGNDKNAKLVIRSAPQLPSVFLGEVAERRKVKAADRTGPIGTAQTQEAAIAAVQGQLKAYDEKTTPSDQDANKADNLAKDLDGKLGTLATHIGTTLTGWGAKDEPIKAFSVPRGRFTYEMKARIAAQHKDKSDLKKDSKGRLVNLQPELARRHVVSSDDMSKHYEAALVNKKWSEGKLLLEQRGSTGESHTPVPEPLNQANIALAANTRYQKFFGYTRNLFIGDSRENSSIQQHLDDGHPDMASNQLQEHVRFIKRAWAIDGSFVETPVR